MNLAIEQYLSDSARGMRASEIRELLKLTSGTDIISFAGGLPNPSFFPIDSLVEVHRHVLAEHAHEALQYCPTEGHSRLREALASGMGERYGVQATVDNILVTSGSQQGLSLLAQVLLDQGDLVLTASPAYLGALLAFRSFGACLEAVPLDEKGMRVDLLEQHLSALAAAKKRVKLLYLIPNFQNPTGITLVGERRRRILELAEKYDFLLLEDDPYGLLRFEGEAPPLLASLEHRGRVIYLGSFSKILAPGYRVAWVCAGEDLIQRLTLAKQAGDLCSNTFGQYCVYEAMAHGMLFPHIEALVPRYRAKRDAMLAAMERHFPPGVRWNRPQGGFFLWVQLPPGVDTELMLPRALEAGVAYVPGKPFHPLGSGENTMRLNFSFAADEELEEGLARLGRLLQQELQKQP